MNLATDFRKTTDAVQAEQKRKMKAQAERLREMQEETNARIVKEVREKEYPDLMMKLRATAELGNETYIYVLISGRDEVESKDSFRANEIEKLLKADGFTTAKTSLIGMNNHHIEIKITW